MNQLLLNCKRTSYLWPFTHDMITQSTTCRNIMYFYQGHLASISLGKEKWVNQKSSKWKRKEGVQSKQWCPSHKFLYVLFSVTQSLFLHGISSSSNNITVSNKKSTSKKDPTGASEIITQYLHKNIKIPLLCKCGLFIYL